LEAISSGTFDGDLSLAAAGKWDRIVVALQDIAVAALSEKPDLAESPQSQSSGRRADALSAGLDAEPSAAWQPIETAPRDGTRFLTLVDGKMRVASWGKTSHVPIYGFCLADQGVEDFDVCTISLWLPLPEAPK